MMNHSFNHPLRRSLIEQLVFIDEHRLDLLDLYLSTVASQEKDYRFFDTYVSELEKLVLSFDNHQPPSMEKVFIGSQACVVFEDDNTLEKFIICFPEHSNPEDGYISFLSPMGRQLLLRGLNEKVCIHTPNGETNVVIKEINFAQY